MNAQEGVNLAKMAVAAMLCTLLVGAIVSLFYIFLNRGDAELGAAKKEVTSINMEKLYSLQDQSLTADSSPNYLEEHPLVSAASASILEHQETDLIYIYVTCRYKDAYGNYAYKNSRMFTYKNVSFAPGVLNSLPGYSAGVAYVYEDTILSSAAKYLHQWAKERCHVSVNDVPYGSDSFTAISVEVLEE